MLEKKNVLEALGEFDVRDLNMVMELLQGKKYVESKGQKVEWSTIMDPLHKATTIATFGKEYAEREERIKSTLENVDELIKNIDKVQPAEFQSDELDMSLYLYIKSKEYNNVLKDVEEVRKGVELSKGIITLANVEIRRIGDVTATVQLRASLTKEMMKELSKRGSIF
jgi:hypothetical protein